MRLSVIGSRRLRSAICTDCATLCRSIVTSRLIVKATSWSVAALRRISGVALSLSSGLSRLPDMQPRYADASNGGRPPSELSTAHLSGTTRRPASVAASSIPSYSASLLSATSGTSDDRSAAIAEYVEKRRQAKLNAEAIRQERAREAERRKGGVREPTATSSNSSTPHVPRSGIVTGASSGASSEATSTSSSRRASRGRDSQDWERSGGATRGAFCDEDDGTRARQRDEAAGEEQQDDDEEPLHRYAKPLSTTGTRISSQPRSQQPTHFQPSQTNQAPLAASTASSSAEPASLQSRVADLEAQVAALQSQQRLFLTFMETTQSQLRMRRAVEETPGAVAVSGRQNRQQPTQIDMHSSSRSSRQQPAVYEYKDETAERGGRRSGSFSDQSQSQQEEEEEGPVARYAARHSSPSPASTQRKQSARLDDDGSKARALLQSSRPAAHAERSVESDSQYSFKAANTPPAPQPPQRPPSRSPPPAASSPPSSSAGSDVLLESDPFPAALTYPCHNCGRSFNEEALERHVAKALCQKAARKPFDVAAQRLQDVQSALREVSGSDKRAGGAASRKQQQEQSNKQSKWRQERARLQEAIQAGKQITAALKEGRPLASIPVAASALPDDRVQCPHCSRRFAEHTAERHIPHCKNTASRMNAGASAAQRRR